MQHSRRRKKRPNYGIRTVEVCRGKSGFGFTISGQQPCILSCIVPNSPAEQAGLRPGDYLIAVCGQNVSKVPHDDVVQLIGNCHNILKLQIAENYYSDSSEEDFVTTARQKPKYPVKCKGNGHNTHPVLHNKSQKFANNSTDGYSLKGECDNAKFAEESEVFDRKPGPFSAQQYSDQEKSDSILVEANTVFQCLVGYLGTIEMPKILTPVSRQQIIRSCIKRLRAEKRNHTAVVMTVFPCSLRLKNEAGTTIAVYPGGRVTFCSSSNEQTRKYFGIVTTSVGEEPSNSCHVFITLSSVHQEHAKIASKFGINCISNANDPECSYFPTTSEPLVNAIRKYYETERGVLGIEEPLIANSPQPSNDSSVTTSNSDSGIGFKDESGHQSDRILVVDIQNQRLHIQAVGQPDPQYIDCYAEKSDSRNSTAANSTMQSLLTISKSLRGSYDGDSQENFFNWNAKSTYNHRSSSRFLHKSCENGLSEMGVSADGSLERRLSPKVFGNMSDVLPVSQSMEDLKTQSKLYEDLEPVDSFMKKHSLQDLTVFTAESETQEKPQSCEQGESERKVTSWATCLEKLLYDTVGLHAFAEFLKKEFSIENAYFWAACEKYRRTINVDERKRLALNIYDKFLSHTAAEPVNVDSSGKNLSQQQLQNADVNLLSNAQKQIFNLMKFDSYPRFLKSEIYKNYLMREISGENITVQQNAIDCDLSFTPNTQHTVSTNNREQAEEPERNQRSSRRRRSLLLWSKSRCKSRDRTASNENISSCSSSRTSLASWDLALPVSLCRVILPDASSAVLNIQPHLTVHYLISKLLEKRAMPYTSFQAVMTATDKVVDLEENASVLAGKEVKIEWRIEFRLDLPDRKSLTVKSKPSHSLGAVLGPLLMKHGYNLQMVTLCLISENEVLEPSMLVSAIDKQRIQVLTRSTPTPNLQGWNYYGVCAKPKQPSTLDEITNRVFEELLQGKAENYRNPNTETAPSIHSEDWSSEHSSKILGKFLRKESFYQDKHRKNKKCTDSQINTEKKNTTSRLPPVIAKWKPGSKLDVRFEKDGLFEGLKRCQRGRLEDQRGTELNIELPDFLKDKENTPSGRKKLKKIRKDNFDFKVTSEKETKDIETNQSECNNSSKIADTYQMLSDCKRDEESEGNIYANDVINFAGKVEKNTTSLFKEPPPLPPKPKNISWRISGSMSYGIDTNAKSVYLDQPTSSFV